MRYIWQHIKTIVEIYKGDIPLAHFLKNHFKQYPVLGSRDRKVLSAMAYSWYRCSKGTRDRGPVIGIEDRVGMCMQLCGNENMLPPGTIKADFTEISFDLNALFPYDITLSDGISKEEWLRSMLSQPHLFIRVRKDTDKITGLLNSQKIPFTFVTDTCLSLPNGAKIDSLLPPETYAVQDASSQQTGSYFHSIKNEQWYDCCAGAGGKSLLLKDQEPGVQLTVTDIRGSIIHNLQKRFRQYGHVLPAAHITNVADEAQLNKALHGKLFDNIICDAPCSGSGTWSRTPEQLYFFDEAALPAFSSLQKTIAINVSQYLKPGGRLIYITCSVFKSENEEVVAEITKQTGLQLEQSQLINGISIHADSMFVALFRK